MKLTRKKSIKLCIELWTWCAETGLPKEQWPRWKEFEDIIHHCWFCEYSKRQIDRYGIAYQCKYCPYFQKFGDCEYIESPFMEWFYANDMNDIEDCKKYAKLFLEQIKTLE